MSPDICDPVRLSVPTLLPAPLIPLRIPTDTGDRPYKCQHCGDQFARSDLLSRHINKCHPNEKPLVSSTPSRRKGTSSASRATTSKQAVINVSSRLYHVMVPILVPSVCTGRRARPPHDSSNPAHPPLGALPLGLGPYRLSDPFFLANNGSALNPSALSQSNPLYADHQFLFLRPRRPPHLHTIPLLTILPAIAPRLTFSPAPSFPLNNDPQDYPLPPSPNRVDYGYNIDNKSEYPNNVLGYSTNGYNPHDPLTFNHDTKSTNAASRVLAIRVPPIIHSSNHTLASHGDGVVQDREGFSSAFGLMSLDDSEVLAGLGEGHPSSTTPLRMAKRSHQQQQQQDLSHGQVGNGLAGTPASLKELKEIWKQYMKTPFSGQPLAHDHHPAGSPKRERGLSRVASLPSVKTPSIATAGWADPMRGVNGLSPATTTTTAAAG
ncbi:hypothetical protein BJV77DRAFT_1068184 [Russula vinacea]|nr:hypothetical protein BJV77DRAFT_1068184 [Russula vinacea]